MVKYNKFLYDNIGNEYERKNLYLLDIAELNEKIEYASQSEKKQLQEELKGLVKNKSTHPYVVELKRFIEKEKEFLKKLKGNTKTYVTKLDNELSHKAKRLKAKLYEGKEKAKFYERYVELSHDASLAYEEAVIINNQMGEVIDLLVLNEKALVEAKLLKNNINLDDEKKANEELIKHKAEQKLIFDDGVLRLKGKKKKGLISEKALKSEINELKKNRDSSILIKSYDSPKKSNKELIDSLKYKVTKGIKKEITVLNSNIADLRRKTPVEINKTIPVNSIVSVLLPGLGQILNKQYLKSILFILFSYFIYFLAIPYALGYGNYQGEGIAGLISLAEGGAKIDKSLIFMIEGVLAVFFVLMALLFAFVSFKDVFAVERDKIKGVRPKNWFEIKTSVFEDGFPYMVTFPAFFTILFIVVVPITTALLLSFTNMDPKHQSKFEWIGLENYKMIALGEGIAGGAFWHIFGWTIAWTLISTSLAIFIGFFLALLVNNERVKLKGFFRVIYILPWAVPSFISVMFFSIMLSPDGALTSLINSLFANGAAIEVKNDPFLSRVAIIMIQGWLGSAYVFVLSTGVLQGIPSDLYEAAQIDGATAWQKLRRITLPLVLFQTAPLLVGQYTFNFNNFSIIYLFNSGGPFNPSVYGNLAGSTDLLISYIFKLTTENRYQAIGAAITLVISLGLMLFAFIGFRNSKAFKEEKI